MWGPAPPHSFEGVPGTGAAASQADVSWREQEPHREASARARAAGSPAGGPGRPSLVVAAASVFPPIGGCVGAFPTWALTFQSLPPPSMSSCPIFLCGLSGLLYLLIA